MHLATSNAPQIGQKRRLSSAEPEELEQVGTLSKRSRQAPAGLQEDALQTEDLPSRPGQDTQEVKEVTKGVRDVELEDKGAALDASAVIDAAAVPLPGSPVLQATQATQAAAIPLPDSPVLEAIQNSKDAEDVPVARPLEEHILGTDKDAEGEEEEEEEDFSTETAAADGQVKEQEGSRQVEEAPVPSVVEEALVATRSAATDAAVEKEAGVIPSTVH